MLQNSHESRQSLPLGELEDYVPTLNLLEPKGLQTQPTTTMRTIVSEISSLWHKITIRKCNHRTHRSSGHGQVNDLHERQAKQLVNEQILDHLSHFELAFQASNFKIPAMSREFSAKLSTRGEFGEMNSYSPKETQGLEKRLPI